MDAKDAAAASDVCISAAVNACPVITNRSPLLWCVYRLATHSLFLSPVSLASPLMSLSIVSALLSVSSSGSRDAFVTVQEHRLQRDIRV